MANDIPNQSGKGPANTIAGIGSDHTPIGIASAIERASKETLKYKQLTAQVGNIEENPVYNVGKQFPGQFAGTDLEQQFIRLDAQHKRAVRQQEIIEESSRIRTIGAVTTNINRSFASSTINGQVESRLNSPQIQRDILRRASSTSPESVQQEMLASTARLSGYEKELHGIASNKLVNVFGEVDPDQQKRIGEIYGLREQELEKRSSLYGIGKVHKERGLDPMSRTSGILATETAAMGTVGSGGAGSNEAKIFLDTLQKLNKVVDTTSEEFKDLSKNLDVAKKNYEMAGGGGGGGYNKGDIAAGLAGGFQAIGGAAQSIMINQRMQQVSNIGGYANLANQQYDMYTKARGGDIASQLALGQFNKADDFGMELKRATNIVQGANAAGAVAQSAAGGIQMAEGLGQKGNPLAYASGASTQNTAAVITGAQNLTQGVAATAVIASDIQKGASAEANRLAGINAQMQARKAINAVGASQAQGLRDFYTGLDVVGQSMGGRASSFIQDSTSSANLQTMQNARMSPQQFLQMSQFGASNMGSTFNANQVFASRNLESRGFGSMQENMQRMSQLASAGANNPREGMENVLSAAMSKGLDSSKAISMMVENTAAMVQTSAGAAVGIDTTGAATSLLAAGVNTSMGNKEFAAQQAFTAAELTRQQTTNRDVSFLGMANTVGLQMALGKKGIDIGGDQAINLQGIDVATLKSLQSDPTKAAEFFKDKGINIKEGNANTAVSTILREKQLQVIRSAGITQGINAGDVLDKMNAGTLSDAEKSKLATGAVLTGRTGFNELQRQVSGITAPNVSPGVGKSLAEEVGPDNIKKQMDLLRTSGFKQLTEAASFASTNLEKFGGALKVFTDLTEKFEKGGVGNEKEFSGAAAEMAKDFSASTKLFNDATTTYEKASQAMMNAAGLFSNRNPVKPAFLDNKNQKTGSTRGAE